MFIINTIDVEVQDVPDPATIAAIRGTAHSTFSHLVGAWHVKVAAADERGYWDLRVRGGFGRHIARFLASPDRVAEGVERRLHAFLRAVVPPLSSRPRRPVLVMRAVEANRSPLQFVRQPQWSRNREEKAS